MLKGIDPIISAPLISALMEMGHGDEIVFGDANFPAASHTNRLIYACGHSVLPLLQAVLKIFPLDYAVDFSGILMRTPPDYPKEPPLWEGMKHLLQKEENGNKPFLFLSKPEFYARAKEAYAVVTSGEVQTFANIILRKGIITSQ